MNTCIMRIVLALLLIQAAVANGEVFRCRNSDGIIEYKDRPCSASSITESHSTSFPAEKLTAPASVQATAASQNSYKNILDREIDIAIGEGDLRRAKELALTPEHWAKIRLAEQPKQKTAAEIQRKQSESMECTQAKRSYELEAGTRGIGKESIDAKKRLMYSACAMREPDSINIGNSLNVYR